MEGFIDRTMKLVDLKLKEHGMAGEAEVRFQMFLAGRPRAQYDSDDPKELQKQLNGLADLQVLTIRERDKFKAQHLAAGEKLRFLNIKFWVVSCSLVAAWAVIGWLATQLFSRLH